LAGGGTTATASQSAAIAATQANMAMIAAGYTPTMAGWTTQTGAVVAKTTPEAVEKGIVSQPQNQGDAANLRDFETQEKLPQNQLISQTQQSEANKSALAASYQADLNLISRSIGAQVDPTSKAGQEVLAKYQADKEFREKRSEQVIRGASKQEGAMGKTGTDVVYPTGFFSPMNVETTEASIKSGKSSITLMTGEPRPEFVLGGATNPQGTFSPFMPLATPSEGNNTVSIKEGKETFSAQGATIFGGFSSIAGVEVSLVAPAPLASMEPSKSPYGYSTYYKPQIGERWVEGIASPTLPFVVASGESKVSYEIDRANEKLTQESFKAANAPGINAGMSLADRGYKSMIIQNEESPFDALSRLERSTYKVGDATFVREGTLIGGRQATFQDILSLRTEVRNKRIEENTRKGMDPIFGKGNIAQDIMIGAQTGVSNLIFGTSDMFASSYQFGASSGILTKMAMEGQTDTKIYNQMLASQNKAYIDTISIGGTTAAFVVLPIAGKAIMGVPSTTASVAGGVRSLLGQTVAAAPLGYMVYEGGQMPDGSFNLVRGVSSTAAQIGTFRLIPENAMNIYFARGTQSAPPIRGFNVNIIELGGGQKSTIVSIRSPFGETSGTLFSIEKVGKNKPYSETFRQITPYGGATFGETWSMMEPQPRAKTEAISIGNIGKIDFNLPKSTSASEVAAKESRVRIERSVRPIFQDIKMKDNLRFDKFDLKLNIGAKTSMTAPIRDFVSPYTLGQFTFGDYLARVQVKAGNPEAVSIYNFAVRTAGERSSDIVRYTESRENIMAKSDVVSPEIKNILGTEKKVGAIAEERGSLLMKSETTEGKIYPEGRSTKGSDEDKIFSERVKNLFTKKSIVQEYIAKREASADVFGTTDEQTGKFLGGIYDYKGQQIEDVKSNYLQATFTKLVGNKPTLGVPEKTQGLPKGGEAQTFGSAVVDKLDAMTALEPKGKTFGDLMYMFKFQEGRMSPSGAAEIRKRAEFVDVLAKKTMTNEEYFQLNENLKNPKKVVEMVSSMKPEIRPKASSASVSAIGLSLSSLSLSKSLSSLSSSSSSSRSLSASKSLSSISSSSSRSSVSQSVSKSGSSLSMSKSSSSSLSKSLSSLSSSSSSSSSSKSPLSSPPPKKIGGGFGIFPDMSGTSGMGGKYKRKKGKYSPSFIAVSLGITAKKGAAGKTERFGFAVRPMIDATKKKK